MAGVSAQDPGLARRVLFSAILAGGVLLVAEAGARAYLAHTLGTPFLHPGRAIYRLYPELRHLESARIPRKEEEFDVLLLGGSALHPAWGTLAHALEDELSLRTTARVRIHNASAPGHTSRDSLLKYRRLAQQRFDLVLVYHGINETRANNVPDQDFRADYSHMAWYRRANWLADHSGTLRWTALPYTLHEARTAVETALGVYRPIAMERPDPATLRHGAHVKSPPSLRANLEEIAALARERGDRLLLLTFAWYLPPDYSRERFRRHELDYAAHWCDVELWGEPANVVAGLDAHNAVIREVAAAHPEALFVDQAARFPRQGPYFNDICHFSARGGLRFVAPIVELVLERGLVPPRRSIR